MTITNGLPVNSVGFFSYEVDDGGRGIRSTITLNGTSGVRVGVNALFDNVNFVDVGANGGAIGLHETNVTLPATQLGFGFGQGVVESRGSFTGANGPITWRVTTQLAPGSLQLVNTVQFTSISPFGSVNFINYLDEDVLAVDDDLLYAPGIPGSPTFQVFTLDGAERIGFSQGGVYTPNFTTLQNATWLGYAADAFPQLEASLRGGGTAFSPAGNIDTVDLPPFTDVSLGQVFGLNDVTTAFAWSLDPRATTATITTFLTLNPNNTTFNRRPVAGNDAATTVNGVAVSIPVLNNDTDFDGTIAPSSVNITSAASRGTTAVNADGTITYTPTEVFIGSDSFTYTVADSGGAVSNRASVVITISLPPLTGPMPPTVPITPIEPTVPIIPIVPNLPPSTPVDVTGPVVQDVFRLGTGRSRPALLVTFSEALDPAVASNLANYVIVAEGRGGRRVIPLSSANYDPNSRSVKLFPRRRLDLPRRFQLTIRASSPSGVAAANGRLLDGNGDGRAGGDFTSRMRPFGRE